MRRLLILFVTLLHGVSLASAQTCGTALYEDQLPPETRARMEAEVLAEPFAQGLMWQATRDDQTVFLIGTIHVPDPRLDAMADRAQPLLDQSGLLLAEMTSADMAASQTAVLTEPDLMFLTDATLPELLDEETWQRLIPAMSQRGMPAVLGSRLKPWALGMILATPPCLVAMQPGDGLDGLLLDRAETMGLPTAAVEDWRDAMASFSSGNRASDLAALRLSLDSEDEAALLTASTIAAFFDETVGRSLWLSLYAAEQEGPELAAMTEALITRLLFDRNAAWIAPIESAAKTHGTITVAVGSAHLPGDHGVLTLLSKNGWTITRLP